MTRQHLWTDEMNQNKLRFTGHILRLPEGTPARQALQIALKPVTRPRGRQKNNMDTIYEHLTPIGWTGQPWY